MAVEPTDAEIASARKVRPGTQRFLRPGNEDETGIPSLMEAEQRIMMIDAKLEDLAYDFERLSDEEARARCDWEEHRDRYHVLLAAEGAGKTVSENIAHAKQALSDAGIIGEELYRAWRITEATKDSCSKHINALQSRLSALQTLIRGLRQLTGLDS